MSKTDQGRQIFKDFVTNHMGLVGKWVVIYDDVPRVYNTEDDARSDRTLKPAKVSYWNQVLTAETYNRIATDDLFSSLYDVDQKSYDSYYEGYQLVGKYMKEHDNLIGKYVCYFGNKIIEVRDTEPDAEECRRKYKTDVVLIVQVNSSTSDKFSFALCLHYS